MATIIDSYSEANQDTFFRVPTNNAYIAQSFANVNQVILGSAKLFLSKTSTLSGNITVSIYAHTGTYGSTGKPTGAVLATSDAIDADSNISSASYQLVTFTFSGANKITLSAATKYCIALTYGGSSEILFGVDSTSPSHAGNLATGDATPVWTAQSGFDAPFYVYVAEPNSNFLMFMGPQPQQ